MKISLIIAVVVLVVVGFLAQAFSVTAQGAAPDPELFKPQPTVQVEKPAVTPVPEAVAPQEAGELSVEDMNGPVAEFKIIADYEKNGSYRRDQFGKAWADVDGNGCDTRNDILAATLTNPVKEGNCKVVSGTLDVDPYTGGAIEFVRGEGACVKTGNVAAPLVYGGGSEGGCSQAVTIDHIIPLEEAWYLGASQWTPQQRETFANDPANLLPTGANSWKGSKTPVDVRNSTNSPMTEAGYCTYINGYINMTQKYDLPVTVTNGQVLAESMLNCR